MNISPLCILQARLRSKRLPGKMLLPFGDETLIARGWRIACEAFTAEHCVVAIPKDDEQGPLGRELRRIGARVLGFNGNDRDVVSRFHFAAHRYRWHPDSVIVRYTPDDPWKDPAALRMVASGERLPVEIGGEAFTLAQLDAVHEATKDRPDDREHLTYVLAVGPVIEAPLGVWTIDTQEEYEACLVKAGLPPSGISAHPARFELPEGWRERVCEER